MSKLTAALMSGATQPAPSEAFQPTQASAPLVQRTRGGSQQHRTSRRHQQRQTKHHSVSDDDDDSDGDDNPDELVPDPVVCREFNISAMTLWRWDHDPELVALGFPPPVIIRKRKFRMRRQLETFKQTMVRRVTADRAHSRAVTTPMSPSPPPANRLPQPARRIPTSGQIGRA